PGSIPSPLERPSGCVFHTRCKIYEEGLCNNEEPQLKSFSSNHKVACLKVDSNE
ncbi:MAG: peptide ABC transporter substrate-binding protein, partial [Rickettsiales bacterium]|nr:peptide ABC transporter substrate-binding protein [Rickettsiales bacterium]